MTVKSTRLILIAISVSVFSMIGCSSSTWDDAQQADTYKSYQSYIKAHPEGTHVEEARTRADSSYWGTIKSDTTAASFETYLKKFPGGQFRTQAQMKANQLSTASAKGRVTGSNIIIRSNHTTSSSSAGVVAKEGTEVQILKRYQTGNSNGAILKRSVTIISHGKKINLPKGKAIHIMSDRSDSVHASFSTSEFGATEATISKENIEAMSGRAWYKIHTRDDITGWIYGKYLKEL